MKIELHGFNLPGPFGSTLQFMLVTCRFGGERLVTAISSGYCAKQIELRTPSDFQVATRNLSYSVHHQLAVAWEA